MDVENMRPTATRIIALHIFLTYLLIGGIHGGFLYGEPCSERNTLEITARGTRLPPGVVKCVDVRGTKTIQVEPYRRLMSDVTTLYAQNKSLGRVPREYTRIMLNLELLDLSGNGIRTFHPRIFRRQRHLTTLLLNGNCVVVPQRRLLLDSPSLQNLHLANNGIKRLSPKAFDALPKLVVLDLQDNRLRAIDACDFAALKELKLLNLNGNQIKTFDRKSMLPTGLAVLDLNRNPIECDGNFNDINSVYC